MRRVVGASVAVAATLSLTACMVDNSGNGSGEGGTGYALPETSIEGYTQVPLYFVSIQGDFPPSTTGREVACGDLLVRRETVPVKSEDPVETSLNYLLHDEYYSHGDPAMTNSLALSDEDLMLEGYDVEGDTVTVRLTGELVTRSECESYRIRAQLYSTAVETAGVQEAEILLNDVNLDEQLGLSPFELGPEITTDAPESTEEPTDVAEGDGGEGGDEPTSADDPVVDSTDGPFEGGSTDPADDRDPSEDQTRDVTEPGSSGSAGANAADASSSAAEEPPTQP